MEIPSDFFDKEIRNDYIVSEEAKKLWAKLLQLALELKRICEKYNLKYFLHLGSLLGAVRHQGFIPWDDDMDFVMPREDFEKFLGIAKDEIKPPYHIQNMFNTNNIFCNGFSLLRIDDTTCVNSLKDLYSKEHQGISIDIGAIDNYSEDSRLAKKQLNKIDTISAMLYLKKYGKKLNEATTLSWSKLKINTYYYFSKILSDKFLKNRLEKYYTMFNKDISGKCIVSHEALGKYRHTVLNKSFYEKSIMMKFENLEFPVPSGYHEILKIYYGENYMELPQIEKRSGHNRIMLSTDESYKTVLSHFHDIFKNVKNKKIVVFGAGQMFEYYLSHTKKKYHPVFVVDNDTKKWNTEVCGIKVYSPEEIIKIPQEEQYVLICSIYYKEIIEQLKKMNVKNYFVYMDSII